MVIEDKRQSIKKADGGIGYRLKEFLLKLKKIKNIEVIVGILILAIILLVYATSLTEKVENNNNNSSVSDDIDVTEIKLAEVLSAVKGAGEVKVMINYDGSAELVTAQSKTITSDSKSDLSGGSNYTVTNTTETSSPVITGGNAVIVKSNNPEIVGVLIVAEGANDISVRLNLLDAAATVLGIDKKLISVTAGEKNK